MTIKEMSREQIEETSMIELAVAILEEEREAMDFNEIFERIASLKGFTAAQKETNIAQFYTDLNVDGGFMTIGTNRWGLKTWYPVEQMEEEIATLPQKRKKKKKKVANLLEDELGVEGFDDEIEEDLDDDLDLTDEDLELDEEEDVTDEFDEDYEEDEDELTNSDEVSFIGDEDEEDES
ncbi:DNA-directed RNA polymerase subunit delta [Halobacillus sp. Marseille-Q1614]|uniref:DNA-directed RNA polymerase subunit delta n=1 Tax=Halobacillus sp. Marseille-Q1614 TaxID=2709134 RepID=UPI00156D8417|nr:DNA-directed RNA polymerase subunit delta [Halobacillus sp. Marseille-Q1614]